MLTKLLKILGCIVLGYYAISAIISSIMVIMYF